MSTSNAYRIASIDILRGLVMIIMALDDTRYFFHSTAMTADTLDGSPIFVRQYLFFFPGCPLIFPPTINQEMKPVVFFLRET